jgi:RHS repeat-associated protein
VTPPLIGGIPTPSTQDNLRKRVAATVYKETAAGNASQASYYSYDLLGNVKVLQQHVEGIGFKTIEYQYDLASGKVNFVAYQHGQNDAFYYKYGYDFENRIIKASSGTAANVQFQGGSIITNEKIDAEYQYYIHGPLARVELGANKVQGIDYAYTLQGWLKGINGQRLIAGEEMGGDGVASTPRAPIARDVVAYSLGYYFNDYQPVGTNTAFPMSFSLVSGDPSGYDLYNGNISHTTVAINKFNSGVPEAFTYKYDQLNRLKQVRHHTVTNTTTTWGHSTVTNKFRESLAYDGNGNIKTDFRNGAGEGAFLQSMDQMTYQYNTAVDPASGATYLVNNRLRHINDLVSATQYSQASQGIQDIDDQTADNYTYDKIGNLIGDKQAALQFNAGSTDPMKFEWTVYGKLKKVTKDANNYIVYKYDPAGNRTSKEVTVAGVTTKTWYVRDAQGNTLALYSDKLNSTAGNWWKEQHLYGSSRLGIWTPEVNISSANGTSVWGTEGKTMYELTNHLGNVLATISDKKIGHNNGSGGIDYYDADVVSASNYYPFGMQMPGRTFTASKYRFGFNGKENDDDVKGAGFQQDYGMRIYDARVGRFMSIDSKYGEFPYFSPYSYAANSPIFLLMARDQSQHWIEL